MNSPRHREGARARGHLYAVALLALGTYGCTGEIAIPAGARDPAHADGAHGDDDGPGGDGEHAPDGSCAPRLAPRLVLLSDLQVVNTLEALFGEGVIPADDAPQRELKPFSEKGTVITTSLVHTRMAWAERAGALVQRDARGVTGCDASDAACVEAYLRTFLPRAFRRPVDAEEVDDLMAVYRTATVASQGLARAIEAAVGSPSFMLRRELGQLRGGTRELDPHELASALSFALTDAPPDDALRAAADSGALREPDEVARQLDRLLALPAVQESLTGTLLAAWGLGNLFGVVKDPALFPEFTPSLKSSMYREAELLLGELLWAEERPLTDLLTTRESSVNGPLAAVYGLTSPAPDQQEFVRVTLPAERTGLLTLPGVLAMLARSDTTSVVARGLFLRRLLCLPSVPAPPDGLADAVRASLEADLTERERAAERARNAACASCHAGIDPFGLMLESFDALGRHRTSVAGEPIDPRVHVPEGVPYAGDYAGATPFLNEIAASDDFGACVAARIGSYATRDDALVPQACEVQAALAGADMGTLSVRELVKRVLTSRLLRVRKEESP